jgi:hypothetical protein
MAGVFRMADFPEQDCIGSPGISTDKTFTPTFGYRPRKKGPLQLEAEVPPAIGKIFLQLESFPRKGFFRSPGRK